MTLLRTLTNYLVTPSSWVSVSKIAWTTFQEKGWIGIQKKIQGKLVKSDYRGWVNRYDTLSARDITLIKEKISELKHKPLISIAMPVYNTDLRWLKRAIDSVTEQLYPHWELCIADDASPDEEVRRVLKLYSEKDARIKIVYREKSGHISAATNSALELCTGPWVAFMDHDDVIPKHALYMLAHEMNLFPDCELIYTDEDKMDESENRFDPHFKPDWNPDLMCAINLFTHLSAYRLERVRKIGGLRVGVEGSQDYDMELRYLSSLENPDQKIRHIPFVLYHWRATLGSTALAPNQKNYAYTAARRAISDYLKSRGETDTQVMASCSFNLHRVYYPIPKPEPKVSIIIPTKDQAEYLSDCVESILGRTRYQNFEILIIDNNSTDRETFKLFEMFKKYPQVKVIAYPKPFNFSAINNFAVTHATGDYLLFLNNDTEVIENDWLGEMVGQAARPGIGAVGGKLLYENDHVQHAGVMIGLGGVAGHPHSGFHRSSPGYFGRAEIAHNVSAVTAACLMVRKSLFLEVGGFDESHLAVAYNDVDLCLKFIEKGLRNVFTPYALLYHYESISRGSDQKTENRERFLKEEAYFAKRWADILKKGDPYYSLNLSLVHQFQPAEPPRAVKPWLN